MTPASRPPWIALHLRVPPLARDLVDALLDDWQSLGTVEGDGGELTAHFSPAVWTRARLESACERALPPGVDWRAVEFADQDWTLPAREHFRGVEVSDRVAILPPWAEADHPLAAREVCLRIEPGMAFGTGTHESTRLALGFLERHLEPGQRVLDLGAGSAILAIAAAQLGAGEVLALEIDPDAEENARLNIGANGVSDRVEYRLGDFTRDALEPADLVLCNTLVEIFEPHLARLRDLTRPGGTLILAGMLLIDEALVTEGLRAVGLGEPERAEEGEWVSLSVRR